MMVDVFKIKKGDTIKFRNGEVHTVTKAIKYTELWVEQHGCKNCHSYGDFGGHYYSGNKPCNWDIVKHIPRKDNNMIDVSNIKVGDRVMIRKGKWYSVQDVAASELSDYSVRITFNDRDGNDGNIHLSHYTEDGFYWSKKDEHGHDIVEHIPNQGEVEEPTQDEMTMRDQFAMSAITGLTGGTMAANNSARVLAELSYLIADEMMKARKEDDE